MFLSPLTKIVYFYFEIKSSAVIYYCDYASVRHSNMFVFLLYAVT